MSRTTCATHSQSRANLLRLSRNSSLPPWWKCRAGREVDDSFSLKTMKVQPSSFTVTDLSSLTAKVSVHLLLSWLWLTETVAASTRDEKQEAVSGSTNCFPKDVFLYSIFTKATILFQFMT